MSQSHLLSCPFETSHANQCEAEEPWDFAYISPRTGDAKHLSVMVLSLEKSLCTFKAHSSYCFYWVMWVSPCAYNIKDLLAVWCANISSSSVERHFIFLIDFYALHKLFGMMYSCFCLHFGCNFQNSHYKARYPGAFPLHFLQELYTHASHIKSLFWSDFSLWYY